MALTENMSDRHSTAALHTAHERCTTIVPVAPMLRLPAAQTEDPSSRAIQRAAKENFDLSQITAVVSCLSRVDGSAVNLKRCGRDIRRAAGSCICIDLHTNRPPSICREHTYSKDPTDPVVREALNALQQFKTGMLCLLRQHVACFMYSRCQS